TEEFLNAIRHTVESELRREGIPARIDGRVKRPYSVFQKMRRQKISLDQVYDLMALRILTDSVKNCYAALGVIHNRWRPIPGRIKDFIAIPRPNLYQSLHTSVVGPDGQTFEVQIRTEEMHRIAEEGIAAHWKYKEGRNGDIVEIMTQPGHEPSKDWLAIVKTSRARNKIKHLINAGERVKAIEIGQKYLEKEGRRLGVQLGKISKAEMEKVASDYGLSK